MRIANPEMRRGHYSPLEVRVLRGAPQGVPVELYYEYREQTQGVVTKVRQEESACRMTVRASRPFPPFEVTSRQLPHGAIDPVRPLPEMGTGSVAVDAAYRVSTTAPAMAGVLGEMLAGFAPFTASGVHLVGDGQSIALSCGTAGFPRCPPRSTTWW
ncbi:hypothetical protein GXW82_08710 [Streptacidiphilus sp. 4-A2]|nr:hypothetical protein [Streptacidiphilus sp. 4-A2]